MAQLIPHWTLVPHWHRSPPFWTPPLTSGVPQGAILSPLLFNITLYDFPRPTQRSQTLIYADDITITCHAKTSATAEAILQPELDRIGRWGDKWGFRFSAQKSAVLVFKRSRRPIPSPTLFINTHPIEVVDKFKFPGVLFDSKLTWKPHILTVRDKIERIKNFFRCITGRAGGPSTMTLIALYKALIRSRYDYGLIAYCSACKSNLNLVETAIRPIIRLILGSLSSKLYTCRIPVRGARNQDHSPTQILACHQLHLPAKYKPTKLHVKPSIHPSPHPKSLARPWIWINSGRNNRRRINQGMAWSRRP